MWSFAWKMAVGLLGKRERLPREHPSAQIAARCGISCLGFQAILVPSLFQKVFGCCTCICSLDSLFGSHWSRRPYWFACVAKAPAWLSRILSRPFVAQKQTIGPSSSCSTTLLHPVCVSRTPKISRSFPASSAIFLCLPKVLFRRRAWLRPFALEPCDAPVWQPPVALALLPEPQPAPCAFRRFSPFGPPQSSRLLQFQTALQAPSCGEGGESSACSNLGHLLQLARGYCYTDPLRFPCSPNPLHVPCRWENFSRVWRAWMPLAVLVVCS